MDQQHSAEVHQEYKMVSIFILTLTCGSYVLVVLNDGCYHWTVALCHPANSHLNINATKLGWIDYFQTSTCPHNFFWYFHSKYIIFYQSIPFKTDFYTRWILNFGGMTQKRVLIFLSNIFQFYIKVNKKIIKYCW